MEYFQRLLIKRKEELEESLAEFEKKFSVSQQDSSSDLSTQPTHIADLAADSQTREEEACFIESAVDELRRVNRALEKIHSNTYGYCEECGQEIDIKRLEAIPYAEFCVKCGGKL